MFDLPFNYTGSFVDVSKNTSEHGKVSAYFDHQYPTMCESPNVGGCSWGDTRAVNFYGYDGDPSLKNQPPYKVYYNGHDGIDFALNWNVQVLAVATGTVTFVGGVSTDCGNDETKIANVVKVRHENGYVTEYWHLSSFAPNLAENTPVTRESINDPNSLIGYVGSTGCSTGPHLHLLVRNPYGVQVDPYDWKPRPDAFWYNKTDPWQQYESDHGGITATSHYLWVHPLETVALIAPSASTVITSTSGQVVTTVPAGVYGAPLRMELAEALHSAYIPGYQSLRVFSLFGFTTNNVVVTTLGNRITLDVYIPSTNTMQALEMTTMTTPTLQVWNTQTSTWQELPTTWDPLMGRARATSLRIGTFALSIREYNVYLPMVFRSAD